MNLRERKVKEYVYEDTVLDNSDEYDEYTNSRYISKNIKEEIIRNQDSKCNNSPDKSILFGYECPFWKWNQGIVDSSGLEFDHIEEWSLTKNNKIQNIQGLCVCCHKMKTKIFMNHGKEFTFLEILDGKCKMDVDIVKKNNTSKNKRRRVL